MRDLVETIIGQVLKQKPTMKPMADANQTASKTSQVQQPLDTKDKDAWAACCQFEAIFLQQMMQAMRKTVPESEMMPRSYASSTYDSMMDQAIAESGSRQAPLGLAVNMYRQLERDGYTHQGNNAQGLRQLADSLKTDISVSPPSIGGSNG
ncbi:MAG TPA: hypothetical protein EYP39_04790 [Ghiorsea sp.]|nr:hypothetical protein [Ghiorsea sp.]HIP06585.1 hypothetical protein [Mariprofundaceae bacterium]